MGNVHHFRESMAGERWVFKKEDPNNPEWCTDARKLVDWATDKLMKPIAADPTDGKIMWALGKLNQVHRRFADRAEPPHQASARQADHPCLDRAYVELSREIEDLDLLAPIPELEPPSPPTPLHAVEEPAEDPGPPVEQVSGIVIGHTEEDPEEPGETKLDNNSLACVPMHMLLDDEGE